MNDSKEGSASSPDKALGLQRIVSPKLPHPMDGAPHEHHVQMKRQQHCAVDLPGSIAVFQCKKTN